MELTEFQYSLGIKDDSAMAEYAFILRGLIRELFSKYGIAITKDLESYSETINGSYDEPIQLTYKNLESVSIGGFTEDTDYTFDSDDGTITILSTGSMNESTDYITAYTYYLIINSYTVPLAEVFPDKTITEFVEPPPDLKYAFFTAAQMRYENLQAKTHMISSVTSPEGSKTTYKPFKLPGDVTDIFEHYSPLGYVSVDDAE